jgi:nicotinamidase-related amidase
VRYLLFTECLQNDFVAPLTPGAPLPNELHIGRSESRRLLGDPEGSWAEEGPLARFLRAFQAGASREHAGIHVRDWHDPADPATRAHLEHFGTHCVRETAGARFVDPLEPLVKAGGTVVDSAVLSDFVGTTLEGALRPLLEPEVRAGIVGVWTDFKVQYLAYELMTRLGLREIAVCGALTASRSRLAHRQALEHLSANLGVAVVDSIPEFLAWLGIEKATAAVAAPAPRSRAKLELADGTSLDEEERRLVEYLFRECREVRLVPIGGGYSGSRVFGCRPVDRMGRREIPFVVKIDRHDRIARERVAVESVENLLGANAPRLADYVDLETRGAIKYHFATMYAGQVRTLQRAVREASGPEAVRALFDRVIERLLRRLYQSPVLDRLSLFEYYSYQPRYADSTLQRIAALAEVAGDRVRVPGLEGDLRSPSAFYEHLFEKETGEAEEVPCAVVHGDLNLANVLLDDAGNTWLIDYYWTRMGHALDDVAKLENDLKFLMVPLEDDVGFARAAALERHLVAQEDLMAPLPPPEASLLQDRALARVYPAIAALRALAADLLREAGLTGAVPARQYRIAQLRYSAHTTSFEECSLRQKRLALVSTCLLAERLLARLDPPAPSG